MIALSSFSTGFLMGAIGGFIAGVVCFIAISALMLASEADNDYDDSLERLRAAARHPTNRVP